MDILEEGNIRIPKNPHEYIHNRMRLKPARKFKWVTKEKGKTCSFPYLVTEQNSHPTKT
jgi:hypothetical protein